MIDMKVKCKYCGGMFEKGESDIAVKCPHCGRTNAYYIFVRPGRPGGGGKSLRRGQ